MCLTDRLAELRRKKANAIRRDDHVRRITTKGRHFRRTPRRSGKVQRPLQPVEDVEHRRRDPRWKAAPRGKDRRKGRAKKHNRPECSTRIEEEAEIDRHDTVSTK